MSNPQRAKGTKGEGEVVTLLADAFPNRIWRRSKAGDKYDIYNDLVPVIWRREDPPIKILATRPDRGEWLFTIRPDDLSRDPNREPCVVEVKRRATLWHHTLFTKEVD